MARDDQVLKTLVMPYFANWILSSITSEQVEGWVAELVAKGYSTSTIHKPRKFCPGVLRSAVRARPLP